MIKESGGKTVKKDELAILAENIEQSIRNGMVMKDIGFHMHTSFNNDLTISEISLKDIYLKKYGLSERYPQPHFSIKIEFIALMFAQISFEVDLPETEVNENPFDDYTHKAEATIHNINEFNVASKDISNAIKRIIGGYYQIYRQRTAPEYKWTQEYERKDSVGCLFELSGGKK